MRCLASKCSEILDNTEVMHAIELIDYCEQGCCRKMLICIITVCSVCVIMRERQWHLEAGTLVCESFYGIFESQCVVVSYLQNIQHCIHETGANS